MTKISNNRRSEHSIMANGGKFGPVVIVSEGVRTLTLKEQSGMTIEQAMKVYENGLALVVA